jgi:hypothetical protein
MVEKIIFHVGAPKTGSTYLQKRLKANADILLENNLCYPIKPGFEKLAANAKLVTLGIDNSLASGFARNFPDFDVTTLDPQDELERLIALCPSNVETAILSSEKMRPRHAKPLSTLIKNDMVCQIVLFVRRQDDWMDSYINQLIKNNNIDTIEEAFEKALNPEESRYCSPDWLFHYKEWSKYFEDIRIIFYDDKIRSIFEQFTNIIGFESTVIFREIERANTSLSLNELAYLNSFKSTMPPSEFVKHRRASRKVALSLPAKRKRFSFLLGRHRQGLIDQFGEANQKLIELLGAKEGLLDMRVTEKNGIDLNVVRQSRDYKVFYTDVVTMLEHNA